MPPRQDRAPGRSEDSPEDSSQGLPPEERPTYNLRAVVQRTGLKADTLRAWERRYGLPMPERTPGGHRIYSEADVQCLHWLIARQEEGMNISQAVKLWQRLAQEGRLPPPASPAPLAARSAGLDDNRQEIAEGGVLDGLRRNWVAACVRFEEREAEQILAQAFALYPPETVCLQVLQKGISQIGMDWYRGKVTAQQEHFATALAIRRLETLLTAAPYPTQGGRVVVGCPPHENHTFSPLLITVMLRRRGWDVLYLGANLPQEELTETVRVAQPDLVVLVAQQLATAATLMEMAAVLVAEQVRVAYGGQIFNLIPDLRKRIPGHFLGLELATAATEIERLLVRPPLGLPAQPIPGEYQRAHRHFQERQAQIDAYVWQVMSGQGMPASQLAAAQQNFGRDLTAALALGYLGTDLNWIAGLLSYRQVAPASLIRYLAAYREAAKRFLDEPGELLVAWLDALLDQDVASALDIGY